MIVAVQLQRSISYSLEELYQAVENMCSHKMAANLYSNLRRECDHHVQSLVPKFNQYPLHQYHVVGIYSGTPLIQTQIGQKEVSILEKCSCFRGKLHALTVVCTSLCIQNCVSKACGVWFFCCFSELLCVYRPEMGDSELLLMVSKQWNDHCNQMVRDCVILCNYL